MEQIVEAIRIAKQEGLSVSLDLASFEMVRDSRSKLINLLETGNIDLCFANEDEAREVIGGGPTSDPEEALAFLGKYCKWAVVTLASKGCMAKHGKQVRFKFLSNCKLHGQFNNFCSRFRWQSS
jgi:sugar/nucleoside kinase (ribokinase family)